MKKGKYTKNVSVPPGLLDPKPEPMKQMEMFPLDATKYPNYDVDEYAGVASVGDGYDEAFQEYDMIVAQAKDLCRRKARDYGSESLTAFGAKGILVRIWDKVCRLKNLLWSDKPMSVDEAVDDTFIDLINYAIICVALRRGKWQRRS